MDTTDLALLQENPEWFSVLAAYHVEAVRLESNEDADGWIPRIRDVEGVKDERLPRIHGKLIAHGFLKFELSGRMDGVRYCLSKLGRQMIDRLSNEMTIEDDEAVLARSA